MPIRTRTTHELIARRDEAEDGHDDFAFGGLHLLVAGLFLASGAEAALGERRGEYAAAGTRWGPLAAAPLAAAAHAARAIAPCRAPRTVRPTRRAPTATARCPNIRATPRRSADRPS